MIMKKKIFTVAAIVMALLFWFFDASVHYFLYKEPQFEFIPRDINELWMRTLIVVLIMLFGIFADFFTNKLLYKQKQLEVARTYGAMMHASHHILNNLLNQMHLFRIEALKSKDFDRDVIKFYDNAIQEASNLTDTFSKVGNLSEGNSWPPLDPEFTSNMSSHSDPNEAK